MGAPGGETPQTGLAETQVTLPDGQRPFLCHQPDAIIGFLHV